MSTTLKTIQILLPGGDPQGIRIAELTTRIVQVVEVPRKLLGEFLEMPESERVAVYFLVAISDDGTERRVYVGQTGDLRNRLLAHEKEKEFWQSVLVVISRTNSLTQTHALFLEWHSLQTARKAGRYADTNGNGGSKPYTPAPLEADCLEFFEHAKTLLATLGYPIFEPITKATSIEKADDLFYCKSSGANARGLYTQEGFVVLKGSTGRRESVPSIIDTADERFRSNLIKVGVMREDGNKVVFDKDYLFRSPSMAAVALTGRTANGWREWKSKDGKTLDELKRQAPIQPADQK